MRISDWSSDVCSSDLLGPILALFVYAVFNNVIDEEERLLRKVFGRDYADYCARVPRFGPRLSAWKSQEQLLISVRSEERRVGKECVSTCRSGWSPDH